MTTYTNSTTNIVEVTSEVPVGQMSVYIPTETIVENVPVKWKG